MNQQHLIPHMWLKVEDEANSAAYHIVQVKHAAVLVAEGNTDRLLLDSMVEHLIEANKIVDEIVEHEQTTIDPPEFAEFLLAALLRPSYAEGAIGCLNEHFTRECKEFGRDRAVRLYWGRALHSLWPLLRRAIGKALKWGAVIAAFKRLF